MSIIIKILIFVVELVNIRGTETFTTDEATFKEKINLKTTLDCSR